MEEKSGPEKSPKDRYWNPRIIKPWALRQSMREHKIKTARNVILAGFAGFCLYTASVSSPGKFTRQQVGKAMNLGDRGINPYYHEDDAKNQQAAKRDVLRGYQQLLIKGLPDGTHVVDVPVLPGENTAGDVAERVNKRATPEEITRVVDFMFTTGEITRPDEVLADGQMVELLRIPSNQPPAPRPRP